MAGAAKEVGLARGRGLLVALAILFVGAVASTALRAFGFEFAGPHHARASAAAVDAPVQQSVEDSLAGRAPRTVDEAVTLSLAVTGRMLHFGLSHPTKLSFTLEEREGNCIEYANLFARIFELVARRASLAARVYAIHSDHARLLGETVPLRGWGDHDWVLVVDVSGKESRRLYVDPTLHDMGLGWDIARNVKGGVSLP